MRPTYIGELLLIIAVVLLLGYGLTLTSPKKELVNQRVQQLLSVSERKPIKKNVMEDPLLSEIENYKSFGTHPVNPNPGSLTRENPFEGI